MTQGMGKNAAVLTASSLVMRLLGMVWQIWLAGRLGAVGIGLLGLVMSVGFFFSTAAVSGIRFAVTRLLSEELGRGREGSVGAVIFSAGMYAAFFGAAAAAGLWLLSPVIAGRWIGDMRTAAALRLLAPALPAGAFSSLLAGYFTAVGRVYMTAGEQLAEQLVRMGLTALALGRLPGAEPGTVCAAAVGAGTAADILGAWAMGALYALDRRRHAAAGERGEDLTPRLLRIAVPLALSAWARSALSAVRQLLAPRGLRQSGLSADAALAGNGVINGMALPLLTFPACLPAAVSELLVPALTRAQTGGRDRELKNYVNRLLFRTFFLSLGAAAAFYVSADLLAGMVYRNREAARFIRSLAPMVPFIYTDIVTDGCLKGLGEMMSSMAFNLAEALLGLGLIWALLPRRALAGYVFTLYACEIFNFTLSVRRLYRVL